MKNNIQFWLKKMYLLQQIPFSDSLIQKGIQEVDVWLCSTGGAGSNLLKDYLQEYINVKSPYSAALLTHHQEPVNVEKKGFKAIYLHADPFSILKSVKRRNLIERNIMKLNNSRSFGSSDKVLLESVFKRFENWTNKKVNYPILCVKYEALYESLDELSKFLNVPFDNFPAKKDRISNNIEIDEKLYDQFSEQYLAWKSYPDVVVI
jgi:hypothetical protein